VFPRDVPESFSREQGLTPTEWERDLPGALNGRSAERTVPGEAELRIGNAGRLSLRWQALPPRQIALMRMPRLLVEYRFAGCTAEERSDFMRYFDLFMQRGGG
jgi:hypothetical protein